MRSVTHRRIATWNQFIPPVYRSVESGRKVTDGKSRDLFLPRSENICGPDGLLRSGAGADWRSGGRRSGITPDLTRTYRNQNRLFLRRRKQRLSPVFTGGSCFDFPQSFVTATPPFSPPAAVFRFLIPRPDSLLVARSVGEIAPRLKAEFHPPRCSPLSTLIHRRVFGPDTTWRGDFRGCVRRSGKLPGGERPRPFFLRAISLGCWGDPTRWVSWQDRGKLLASI